MARESQLAANHEVHHATDRLRGAAHVSMRHLRTRHDHLDDATIAQKVRSEALGPFHHGFISVDAAKGIIYLRGEVGSVAEISELISAANRVRGVRRVTSYLHLPGVPATDQVPVN